MSRARQRLADARAQNRQNPAAAPRAMLLSRKETEARPAPAQPAPYGYGAPAPAGAGAATADAIARARARVSAPAAPAIETPAPNMASPHAPPVESIDDDGTVA